MSTRRDLWQLLWEVGTARRLSRLMLSRGQGPIWQSLYDRYIWDKFSGNQKRAIRDYVNDLEIIVLVILENLGLPELAVEKIMLVYGYDDKEEVEGDKELVWNAF